MPIPWPRIFNTLYSLDFCDDDAVCLFLAQHPPPLVRLSLPRSLPSPPMQTRVGSLSFSFSERARGTGGRRATICPLAPSLRSISIPMPWSIQFVLQSRFMIYGKVGPLPSSRESRPTLCKGDESVSVGWNLNVFLFADAEGGARRTARRQSIR